MSASHRQSTHSPASANHRRRSTRSRDTIIAAIAWGALFALLLLATSWSAFVAWLLAGTVTTFCFYAYDKWQARRHGWRVPERVLQGMVLAGGVIGGWIGMLALRHKTLHRGFWAVQWVATAIYVALGLALLR